ncbi:MAG: hypothetical protein CBB87_01290 [Micavibrio sp. TMED27]|nr:hypothetical protein [Micavibrio sp.]OUT92404.1 MAG: hypothetical protein CBB87_01290 [Micavibrio sp. TMED27]|tara:strand:+ start:40 stop:492 length:453 start_codon:yes stop_codon:yes gene_type:complete
MKIRSYLISKAPSFAESEVAPIHLGDLNGRHYYAFAKGVKPVKGSKNVEDSELEDVIKSSLLIQQIKEEAARRILLLAPQWKQQNALIDIYLFGKLERLDEQQQARLQEAEALLQSIQDIRQRSDEIEASFLKGVAVEYLTDQAWESDHA